MAITIITIITTITNNINMIVIIMVISTFFEGMYECQISTEPKISKLYKLTITGDYDATAADADADATTAAARGQQ